MKLRLCFLGLLLVGLLSACSHQLQQMFSNNPSIDLTDKILTQRSYDCADYSNSYEAKTTDVYRRKSFDSRLNIRLDGDFCLFESNALPNHSFNNGATSLRHHVQARQQSYKILRNPSIASSITPLSLQFDNAILLNGVKVDILSAGCFGIGDGKQGCHDSKHPFRYDPMSPLVNFQTDLHNAHTQPDGTYHYHGNPRALFSNLQQGSQKENNKPSTISPVIGFAADGFPIFGSYFKDSEGVIRQIKSSYRLKQGYRQPAMYHGKQHNPGGKFDGRFTDDYEYVENLGDLDECNGMKTAEGYGSEKYGYYVTESYPWIIGCFKGKPEASFNKFKNRNGRPPKKNSRGLPHPKLRMNKQKNLVLWSQ